MAADAKRVSSSSLTNGRRSMPRSRKLIREANQHKSDSRKSRSRVLSLFPREQRVILVRLGLGNEVSHDGQEGMIMCLA